MFTHGCTCTHARSKAHRCQPEQKRTYKTYKYLNEYNKERAMIQIALIQRSGPDAELLSVYTSSCYLLPVLVCARSACASAQGGVIEGGIHATFILTEKARTSSMLILL